MFLRSNFKSSLISGFPENATPELKVFPDSVILILIEFGKKLCSYNLIQI